MKASHFLLGLLIALAAQSLRADPSPEIKRLMNEPVSMLDWGLNVLREDLTVQLHDEAAKLGYTKNDLILTTGYDWDHNQIVVSVDTLMVPRATAKADCRRLIEWVRHNLVLKTKDGKAVTFWASMFQHNGYTKGDAADKVFADKLPQLVKISASTWSAGEKGTRIECSGALLEDSISYEEE